MKENSITPQSSKRRTMASKELITIGMDLGDKTSRYCMLDGNGEVVEERSLATTKKGMTQVFGGLRRCRIAIEVGTHSPWVSRLLKSLGHEVIVANARQVKLISSSSRKDDGWTRRCWHGWRGWIRDCCGPSSTGVRKRRNT
jgi:transposase